jgi:hypothetical protein
MFWVFVCSRTNFAATWNMIFARTTEMAPLIKNGGGERIAKREDRHIVVVRREGSALETAVGANDESENQQSSCLGQPWECLVGTASVVFTFSFLYSVCDRLPAAGIVLGVIMLSGSYCNYIFWTCKKNLGSQEGSKEESQETWGSCI